MLKAEEQCVLWWEFYFSIRVFSYRFRKEYSLKDISNHLTFEQSPNCEIYYLEINTRSLLSWKILINSYSFFIPPKNTGKPLVYWCFQRVKSGNVGYKWAKARFPIIRKQSLLFYMMGTLTLHGWFSFGQLVMIT